jgi:hypothetical protein
MTRIALALAIGSLLLPAAAQAGPRYSGTIVAIDPSGSSITLNELGVGLPGGRNQEIPRVIELAPATKLLVATRIEDSEETEWRGGYVESPIAVKDLKPGDYATVEVEARDGRLQAASVLVVRPRADSR